MTMPTDSSTERLTQLEIKACYADDLLEQLNRLVYTQQQQIERLAREIQQLRDQFAQGDPHSVRLLHGDERPPHY